jgi:hypothetical protein
MLSQTTGKEAELCLQVSWAVMTVLQQVTPSLHVCGGNLGGRAEGSVP